MDVEYLILMIFSFLAGKDLAPKTQRRKKRFIFVENQYTSTHCEHAPSALLSHRNLTGNVNYHTEHDAL